MKSETIINIIKSVIMYA